MKPLLVPIAVSSGPITVPGWTVTRGRPAASSSRPTSSDSTLLRRYGSVQPRSPRPGQRRVLVHGRVAERKHDQAS